MQDGAWMMFKSDWTFEFMVLRESLRRSLALKIIFTFAVLFAFALVYLILRYSVDFALLFVAYLTLIPVIRFRPKIYSVSKNGVVIDGTVNSWKNFKGYRVKGEYLFLEPYVGIPILLPKYFEDVVSKYLKKI